MRAIQTRAPDFGENDIARNLEQKITDKEDACPGSIGSIAEAKIAAHLMLGEANIDPVEIGQNVAEKKKWYKMQCHLVKGRFFKIS